MAKHTCCFILVPNTYANGVFTIGKLCGKPTKYKMEKDDDRNIVRHYDSFCPEHRAIVNTQPPFDEDDLD